MLASHLPRRKRRLRKKLSGSQRDDIPLSQLDTSPPRQDLVVNEDRQQRTYWPLVLCYFLHAFLVVLYLVLLGIAVSGHAERRVVIQNDIDIFTTVLSGGLQAFYTLYTALLVFLTQRLMLSSIFSRPNKLTQIHDICGAWAGLGASLNALWQQTKVASSVLSIALVMVYFVCISVLHATSTTLIQLQLFNDTVTRMGPVLATWPNASIDLMSFDWMTMSVLVPLLRDFYGNTTNGLANNTLYDVPLSDFINATVHATTINANCGLLTNLSIQSPLPDSDESWWGITASMAALGTTVSFTSSLAPFLNEILFSSIWCSWQQICWTYMFYYVSAEMQVDDSLGGVNYIYFDGTYPGSTTQNFSTPIYIVACSLNATNHTVILDSSGIQLDSGEQLTDMAWSTFSPGGDLSLTSGISSAMSNAMIRADPLDSIYCRPVLGGSELPSERLSPFNVYMNLILGMTVFPCSEATPGQYPNTPLLLAKDQFESAISQFAAEFLWLAGELGSVGGGFDRQIEEAPIVSSIPQWKLNINTLPVIIAFCASVVLFVLVVCSLRRHHQAVMSSAGVLEMMWFGSRSQVLRSHLSDVRTPSLDSLRTSSMFDTVFWTQTINKYKGNNDFYAPVPLHNLNNYTSSSRPEGLSGSEVTVTLHLSDDASLVHQSNTSARTRRLCYALHIIFVALHIILLALLVHHPEQSVVIPSKTSTFAVGLSALLQMVYTLYSMVLVLLVQRLGLFKIVDERRKLTTVHDVSGAWAGIGAAINILWQQHRVSSSIWEVIGVGTYLTLMLVLHIVSSSIMQWQAFNAPLTGVVQTYLAFPDSSVDISQIAPSDILPFRGWIGTTNLSSPGLSNTTLYDIPQNPIDFAFTFATVNATTLTLQCDLVPNLTALSNQDGMYQINFQNETTSNSFQVHPIGTDSLHKILPSTQCIACSQALFYIITTGVNVDESVQDPVFVRLNFTTTLSLGEPTSAMISTYIAACSVNAQTALVQLNMRTGVLETVFNTTTILTSSPWSLWSPGNATNDTNFGYEVYIQVSYIIVSSLDYRSGLYMESHIMSLLGLNLSNLIQSTANPSVTLSPQQLENAIAQTLASYLWVAGQIGEDFGGFQRSVGESPVMGGTMQFRLHLNTVPVFVASTAAFLSLVLATLIIGKPSGERRTSISGTSVLECLWLEAHSESIHAHMETIDKPHSDRLRAAGMFDICLGDVGWSSYPEAEQPILVSSDE